MDGSSLSPSVLDLASKWGFCASEELKGGYCSIVFANESRILKIALRGEELDSGFEASLTLQQAGGPKVFKYDRDLSTMLMERLIPGSSLESEQLGDSERQRVFLRLIQRIPSLPPSGREMPLREYLKIDHPLLDRLEETTEQRVFLHGDLRHRHILRHGTEWRPIDPKGLVGDPHFDCVAFVRNPFEEIVEREDVTAYLERKTLSVCLPLGFDPWRVVAWAYVERVAAWKIFNVINWEEDPDNPYVRLTKSFRELEQRFRNY